MEPELTPAMPEEKPSRFSKWLWLLPVMIAAVVAIVLGFLWFSNQRLKQAPTPSPSPATEYEAEPVEEESSSDEISAIEVDLQGTDLTDLDQELTEIEAELATP